MRNIKRLSVVLAMILTILAVAMCGYAEEEIDRSEIVVGIAQIQYTSEWRIAETNSMIRALNDAGYQVIYTNAQGDTQQQIANCEDLLARGIDYLMLSPLESNGLTSVLENAKEQGVPIILLGYG